VDGRAGRKNEALDSSGPGRIEQLQRASYIGVVIELWLSDGWANTSPCRQMRDGIEFLAMKEIAHRVVVSQIDLKNRRVIFDCSYVASLDSRIVKIIEVIKNRHAVTKGE